MNTSPTSLFRTLIGLSFLSFPALVHASHVTVCKSGSVERRIEVGGPEEGKNLPCEVKYFKEGQDEPKVLWTAQNDAGYCDTKAKEFAEKLGTMGWTCDAASHDAKDSDAQPKP